MRIWPRQVQHRTGTEPKLCHRSSKGLTMRPTIYTKAFSLSIILLVSRSFSTATAAILQACSPTVTIQRRQAHHRTGVAPKCLALQRADNEAQHIWLASRHFNIYSHCLACQFGADKRSTGMERHPNFAIGPPKGLTMRVQIRNLTFFLGTPSPFTTQLTSGSCDSLIPPRLAYFESTFTTLNQRRPQTAVASTDTNGLHRRRKKKGWGGGGVGEIKKKKEKRWH